MTYNIKQSGECIRRLRIQNGYTQEKLAERLNIDRSLVSHIEAGKRGCSVDLLVQFSALFGVSLDLLVLGKERHAPEGEEYRGLLKAEVEKLIDHLEGFKSKL